jgi:DNA-binding response OmpR family regulator
MPKIALFARPPLRKPIADLVRSAGGDVVVFPQPRSGKELRYFAHQKQPDGVIVDADIGDGWDAIKALPRLALVRARPDVIAIYAQLSQREKKRAMFAGARVAIDGATPSWRDDLMRRIAEVAERHRRQEEARGASPQPSAPPALRIVR